MSSNTDTITTIKTILSDLGIPESDITADARLRQDLELDSTEAVDLSLELHKRFGIKVKIDTGEDMTVQDICTLVTSSVSAH